MNEMTSSKLWMHDFADQEALLTAMTRSVAGQLASAIEARGAASLVVSGGRTPAALFERLSHEDLDWSKVMVTLADERWVPEEDAASNAAMLRRTLLQGAAAKARFFPLYGGEATAEEGQPACSSRLAEMPRPFDLVLLGMGEDGHTASLFPGAPELEAALAAPEGQLCQAIHAPGAPEPRMTLTLPLLLDSRCRMLLITGESKKQVLEEACGDGPISEMPVRAVLRQAQDALEVYWAP